jgi:hypothetical protein
MVPIATQVATEITHKREMKRKKKKRVNKANRLEPMETAAAVAALYIWEERAGALEGGPLMYALTVHMVTSVQEPLFAFVIEDYQYVAVIGT